MASDLLSLLSPNSILIFIIVFTRLAGMISSAPLFSTYPIPAQAKIWLCATVAFIMYPVVIKTSALIVPNNMIELTLFLIKEFFIGFLIGFIAKFIFSAVQIAGQTLGIQMGITMGQVLDPTSNEQTPIIGQVYVYIATIVFISLNAHHWLFTSIYKSFASIPPGIEFIFTPALVKQVIMLFSHMFVISFQIILPIFCVLFVSEVLMGFMAKMMPQMNIFMVALPFKIGLGLILIIMFIAPTISYLAYAIEKYMAGILKLFMGG